jgi:hypothetical protein
MPRIDTLRPELQIEYTVMRDARAVNDAGALRLSEYGTPRSPSWALVEIAPASDSGSATVPGAHIDGETGAMAIPGGVAPVLVKKGEWRLRSASRSDHPAAGAYAWAEPLAEEKRALEPEDFYSPFAYGGMLLFEPNPDGADIDQFHHPRMIFPEWQDMVRPAFAHSTKTEGALDGRSTEKDAEALAGLISGANVLLSALALRESLRIRSVIPQSVAELLHGKGDHLKAVFAYLMLTASLLGEASSWQPHIVQLVRKADRPEDVYALGLGAFAAAVLQYREPQSRTSGRAVLAAAKARLADLQLPPEKAPQLYFMFARSGVADGANPSPNSEQARLPETRRMGLLGRMGRWLHRRARR